METDLTQREQEIAMLIRDGLSNAQIATKHNVKPLTAKRQVKLLMRKLKVLIGKEKLNRADVAVWVERQKAPRRSRIAAGIEAGGPHKGRARHVKRAEKV